MVSDDQHLLSDDFSDELSAVPESEDCIKIEGETYRRLMTMALRRRRADLRQVPALDDESDALDAKEAEDS